MAKVAAKVYGVTEGGERVEVLEIHKSKFYKSSDVFGVMAAKESKKYKAQGYTSLVMVDQTTNKELTAKLY